MRGFVRQSIHWSVGPSIRPTTRQPDKKQSQEIPKLRTYDFFPTARAAFIGIVYVLSFTKCFGEGLLLRFLLQISRWSRERYQIVFISLSFFSVPEGNAGSLNVRVHFYALLSSCVSVCISTIDQVIYFCPRRTVFVGGL